MGPGALLARVGACYNFADEARGASLSGKRAIGAALVLALVAFGAICAGAASAERGASADGATPKFNAAQTEFEAFSGEDVAEIARLNCDFAGKIVSIMAPIDLSGAPNNGVFKQKFCGTFEGNGRVVSGLRGPLFREIGQSGRVRAMAIRNVGPDCRQIADVNLGLVEKIAAYGSFPNGLAQKNGRTGTVRDSDIYCDESDEPGYVVKENCGTIERCNMYCGRLNLRGGQGDSPASLHAVAYAPWSESGAIRDCAFEAHVDIEEGREVCVSLGNAEGSAALASRDGGAFSVDREGGAKNGYVAHSSGADSEGGPELRIVAFDSGGNAHESDGIPQEGEESVWGWLKGFSGAPGGMRAHAGMFESAADGKFGIGDAVELQRLVFVPSLGEDGFDAALTRDVECDFLGEDKAVRRPIFGAIKGRIELGDRVFFKTSENAFGPDAEVEFLRDGEATGFHAEPGFGDGESWAVGEGCEPVAPATDAIAGAGTVADPYLIGDAETLAQALGDPGINAEGKYARVESDIVLNYARGEGDGASDPYFRRNRVIADPAPDVRLCLDFGFHRLANVGKCPFRAVSGALRNVGLEIAFAEVEEYAVAREISESGAIRRAVVDGRGKATYGFADVNAGRIELCNMLIEADFGFCRDNREGQVEASAARFATEFSQEETPEGSKGWFKRCVARGKRYDGEGRFDDSGNEREKLAGTFDLENEFGYEAGKDESNPIVRTPLARFRREFRGGTEIAWAEPKDREYDGAPNPVENEESEICWTAFDWIDIAFEWKLNGEPAPDLSAVEECGAYSCEIVVSSPDCLTEVLGPFEFRITKARPRDESGREIELEIPGFADETREYAGADLRAQFDGFDREGSNIEALAGFGYAIETRFEKDGRPASEARNAGRYRQTVVATADNYVDLALERCAMIAKKEAMPRLADAATTYGAEFDLGGIENSALKALEGLAGVDVGRAPIELMPPGFALSAHLGTDYEKGRDAGEYFVRIERFELENYVVAANAEAGRLIVGKATMACEIEDKTGIEYDGKGRRFDGSDIRGMPQGAGYSFRPNAPAVDAGTHEYAFSATCKNYEPFSKTVRIEISKKRIEIRTVSASNASTNVVEKPYGYAFDPKDFALACDERALANGEKFDAVCAGIEFGSELDSPDAEPNGGDYAVRATYDREPKNYSFVVVPGVLRIEKTDYGVIFRPEPNATREYSGTDRAEEFLIGEDKFPGCDVSISRSIGKYDAAGREYVETSEIKDVGTYRVAHVVTPAGADVDRHVETRFAQAIEITRIKCEIAFAEAAYEYVYDGTERANDEAYRFASSKIPDGVAVALRYFDSAGDPVESLVDAGAYSVKATYPGDENHSRAEAGAKIEIKPDAIALRLIGREFEYSAAPMSAEFEIDPSSVCETASDECRPTKGDVEIAYVLGAAEKDAMRDAGTYELRAESKNRNYSFAFEGAATAIVAKKRIRPLSVFDIESDYGFSGVAIDDFGREIQFSDDCAYLREKVPETQETIRVRFGPFPREPGEYPTSDVWPADSLAGNYELSVVPFFIVVRPVSVRVSWSRKGKALPDGTTSVALEYSGVDASGDFAAEPQNLRSESDKALFSLRRPDAARDAGEHRFELLSESARYVVEPETATFAAIVTPKLLPVRIGKGEVRRFEALPRGLSVAPMSPYDLVGDDFGKNLADLAGFEFIPESASYDPDSSAVGSVHSVGGAVKLKNYDVEIREKGAVVVLAAYPTFELKDATFAYDGEPKSIVLGVAQSELESDGIAVSYEGNGQVDAGESEVAARVDYPTGRTVVLRAKLVILPVEPIVACEPEFGAYRGDFALAPEALNASATFRGRPVAGRMLMRNPQIGRGTNRVEATFIPDDARNFRAKSFRKEITLYAIDETALSFREMDFAMRESDGALLLEKPMAVSIAKSKFPEIADRLDLYLNGVVCETAVFDRTASERLEIKFDGETIFDMRYDIVFGKIADESPSVKIGPGMISGTGAEFSSAGDVLFVPDGRGAIGLDEKWRGEFVLKVNGESVPDSFLLPSDARAVEIEIWSKKHNEALYRGTLEVRAEPNPERESGEAEPTPPAFEPENYYLIGGALGAAVLLSALFFIILRKRRGK